MRRVVVLVLLFGAVLPAVAGAGSAPKQALVTVAVGGKGSLTSTPGGLRCPRHCHTFVNIGVTLRFVATPAKGWTIERWTGICAKSTLKTCSVKVLRNPIGGRVVFKRIQPTHKTPTPPPSSGPPHPATPHHK